MTPLQFVAAHLPPAPARVLEVGCGDGELTRELIDRGYDAHGIDPKAPDAAAFERIGLEDLRTDRPYDVAIAVVSLHHVEDLPRTVERLADAVVHTWETVRAALAPRFEERSVERVARARE